MRLLWNDHLEVVSAAVKKTPLTLNQDTLWPKPWPIVDKHKEPRRRIRMRLRPIHWPFSRAFLF